MAIKLQGNQTGRDFYEALYRSELEAEAEWLRRGAQNKADTIEQFLNRHQIRPSSLVELGAGTGAVIAELERRGVADRLLAIDYSDEALAYLRDRNPSIDTIKADITSSTTPELPYFDVAVLSHVVEHLEDPRSFLNSVRRNVKFNYIVIEVPLENLLAGRFKSKVQDRSNNSAGHVQFFTSSSFENVITESGFRIIDRRRYVPIVDMDTVRFIAIKNNLPLWRRYLKFATERYLPMLTRPLWARFYYAHYAVLCDVNPVRLS
jgi:SAM-dependent methyltransferase